MQRMDGTQTVGELIVDRLQDEGDLDPGAVIGLVEAFGSRGSSIPPGPTCAALVRDHLDRASNGRRKLREFTRNLKIGWDERGAIRRRRSYRDGLKVFFLAPVRSLGAAVALGGLACFVVVQRSGATRCPRPPRRPRRSCSSRWRCSLRSATSSATPWSWCTTSGG